MVLFGIFSEFDGYRLSMAAHTWPFLDPIWKLDPLRVNDDHGIFVLGFLSHLNRIRYERLSTREML